jgi:hypothetical protein
MRQAGKVHPPFEVVGTQMLWLNAFESTGSPGKLRAFDDKRKLPRRVVSRPRGTRGSKI